MTEHKAGYVATIARNGEPAGQRTTYPGGKGGAGVFQQIINQLPPHRVYIECFLGMGAVLRSKRPAEQTIGVEADAAVLARWTGDEVPGLRLVHADALPWLAAYPWQGDELVYADPPYLMETRSSQRALYEVEFSTRADHRTLLDVARVLPCRVAISGYASDLYAERLADWRCITFTTTTRGGRPATEHLWTNYPEPLELHDYQHLGAGFRQRERIKRKTRRWTQRLRGLPAQERHALFAAIEQVRSEQPVAQMLPSSEAASVAGNGPPPLPDDLRKLLWRAADELRTAASCSLMIAGQDSLHVERWQQVAGELDAQRAQATPATLSTLSGLSVIAKAELAKREVARPSPQMARAAALAESDEPVTARFAAAPTERRTGRA
ncbi:MAG: DNA adenine methylase [Thermoleophilaceae bacterium]|nr:DNA adenine methylase [Thermoleophilaceae bacterium]